MRKNCLEKAKNAARTKRSRSLRTSINMPCNGQANADIQLSYKSEGLILIGTDVIQVYMLSWDVVKHPNIPKHISSSFLTGRMITVCYTFAF
jgi:hypothetical protein